MLASLIESLALDNSFFVQFLLFVLMYPVISQILLKPYVLLHSLREEQTLGKRKQAYDLEQKARQLKAQYETKAYKLNQKFQQLYKQKKQALKSRLEQESHGHRQDLLKKYQQQSHLLKQDIHKSYKETEPLVKELKQMVLSKLIKEEQK